MKKTTDEIERESGRFLESILEKAFQSINKKLRPYRLGELKEKGIDFIFEIEERSKADVTQDVIPASNPMIYIQNKGTEALIKQLKKGKRSGKISFQLDDVRQLEYFCFELDQPLFITLCDLTQSQIYWLPVQLETLDYIEGIEAIKNAVKNGERSTSSIYIYFDPEKHLLDGEGKLIQAKVEDFISDHFTAKDSIIDKYINARRNSVSQSALYGMIDQTQHVLDQLYQLCKIVYDEIEYVPPEVLMNLPPFLPKEEEEKKTRYKMFSYNSKNTIITERADLFQMLDKLEIEDGNIKILDNELFKRVKDYREKITYVLKKLTNNHLFSIRHNHNTKDLFYSENNSCDCIRCRYENFDLKGVAEKLGKIPKSNMEEHIMAGYVQFKLGNFGSSAELLLKALELAKEEDQKLSQFIIYHNLKCLPAPRDEFGILNEELEAKLREINLEERYCEFTTIPMKGVVEEIYKGIYVKRAYDGITKLSSKIVTQYHESKNGGTSHNGYVSSLIVYYRRYIYFLRNNLLFTQNIDVPSQLSELYIEGLYASHATVGEGSRLVHFNDGILNELLVNSNSEALMKSFYRYKLDKLVYRQSSGDRDTVWDNIIQIIDKTSSNKKTELKEFEDNGLYYSNRQFQVFRNTLVLAAQIQSSGNDVNRVANSLVRYIRISAIYGDLKAITYFIARRKHLISDAILKRILFASIKRPHMHDKFFWTSISDVLWRAGRTLKFTDREFTRIINSFLIYCDSCRDNHEIDFLVSIYKMTKSKSQREKLNLRAQKALGTNFSFSFFYDLIIYDVTNLDDSLLEIAINEIKPKTARKSSDDIDPIHLRSSLNVNYRLNELINICYKKGVDLGDSRFDVFHGINDYYDWLIRMDDFDYNKLDPEWITFYGTKFYFEKMARCIPLRDCLDRYLKTIDSHKAQNVMNDYLNIYVRESWKIKDGIS